MNNNRLYRTIERHEGYRDKPYRCTAGKLTIGIGWNLDDTPMRYSEARFRLRNDLDECRWDLEKIFPGQFAALPDHIQEVLMNMRFQLGPGRFRSFKKFIAAIRGWDFVLAQKEGLDSKWARHDSPDGPITKLQQCANSCPGDALKGNIARLWAALGMLLALIGSIKIWG